MQSPKLYARITGLLWLTVILTGAYSMFALRSPTLAPGDAVTTARAVLAATSLYHTSLLVDLLSTLSYAGVTVFFFLLLKPANTAVATLAAAFGLMGLVAGLTNLAVHQGPLVLMSNATQLGVFSLAQLQTLVIALIKIENLGFAVAMLFFGCQCFLNGTVVLRSGYFPWFLGVLLMLTGTAYIANFLTNLLAPALGPTVFPVMAVAGFGGEGAMTLWLLIMGVNAEKWKAAACEKAH
jgi:hypothetical protein